MSSQRSVIIGAAIAALCLATAAPAAADIAAAPADPAPPAMIDALERDLGLTEQQVRVRLANEARAAKVESSLTATLGESYAGAWLNHDASRLLVATTDSAQTATIEAQGAQPVLAGRSLAQLDALKGRLDAAPAEARARASLWYVDVATNSVVVSAQQQADAEALITAAGVDKSQVRVVVSAERPQTYINIVGGAAYYIGSGTRCSIGFSASRGGTPGFVTAGHCGRTGARTTQPTGTFVGSVFPGSDYAYVSAPGNTPTPYVRGSGGQNVTVRGSTQASVGASICRSGSTTGWRCGTIQQHNTSVTYPQGTVRGVTRTSACAQPGDSGGSFISGNQAQGVTSGGSGNCSTGGTTFHQPVNPILSAYGATLTVG
ncbi:serine protease [Spongiactinospora gelatinilytica]|uniref:Serine protease n=1 Tax=Spongiactinospora gelatinilytica TaxID=2666298 RepID=A0A2W2GLL3_9ACTN|nr:S1 family peptidase [Spongiactinospora gelatinilytica]PZG38038.1 serine protease [Spongiactinospora gelatinilytica]